MNEKPLITIIIPLYNGSNFIREAIECAIGQTYSNIEVIVVNDGSNDEGAGEKIAMEYKDCIRYFQKENGGVSSALNFALGKMEGEWFSWLSHDDLYTPDKIERQVAYLEQLKQEGQDIKRMVVHCNAKLMNIAGKALQEVGYHAQGKVENIKVMLDNLKHNRLGGCSFLIPKTCFAEIGGFSEQIRTISDFDYWYRILFAGYDFYQMNESLVYYRVHGGQVTYKMAGLGEKEANDFYIWVANKLSMQEKYNNFEIIFFVACCALEKKYMRAYHEIMKLATLADTTKIKWSKLKLLICYVKGVARRLLHMAFIMLKVK